MQLLKLPLIEGENNASQILAGAQTLAVQITHNAGNDFIIEGFRIQYNGSIEEVKIRLYDAQRNRDIITPNTPIGTIGDKRTVAPIIPFQKLHDPIILKSGQSVQLYVNNTTSGTIATKDISLSLFGYQVASEM
jgi:hypothetical protein